MPTDVKLSKHLVHRVSGRGKNPVRRVVRVVPENMAFLQVDLDGKWAWEVFSMGSDEGIPDILLHPVLKEGQEYDHKKIVTLAFTEFSGWSIWAVEMHKDYLSVALWRST